MTNNRLVWTVTAIGTSLILLVQYCIRVSLESGSSPETIPLLPGILHLTYLRGSDTALSLFGDVKQLLLLHRIGTILFVTIVVFFISWLLSKFSKEMMKSLQFGIGLLLAGSISNTIEQIVFNENAVFIDFQSSQIAIFNLADLSLYLGQVISVISLIFLGIRFIVRQWRR